MVDEAQRHRQTPQTSNALDNYYGWNSSMGLDVRNPVDYAIQQAHNRPSNRQPLLNQPPMAGPPQRPHVNPRMRGMGGGGGGLESLQSKVNLQEIMDKMPWMNPYRIIKGLESHGVEYADNDPFDPSRLGTGDPFNNQIFTDPFDPRRLGIEEEPFDPFNPPGWTEPEINDPFNNQVYAARGGLMSLRR